MESAEHKLVILVAEEGVDQDVMEVMAEMGLNHYTKLTDVVGSGETGRRDGDAIWPGLNTVLMIYMPADQVQPLVDRCHEVRATYPITPGMKFFILTAEML